MIKYTCLLVSSLLILACNKSNDTFVDQNQITDTSKKEVTVTSDSIIDYVFDNYTIADNTAKKVLRNLSIENLSINVVEQDSYLPFTDAVYHQKPLFTEFDYMPTLKVDSQYISYDQQAYNMFTQFADSTGGKSYRAKYATEIPNILVDILNNHTNNNTDLVFLIDKSTSMVDDIAAVKKTTYKLLNILKKFENIKVGLATYADSIGDGSRWYNIYPLTNNLESVAKNIKKIKVHGGGLDIPESVNDAIVKTVSAIDWTPGSKRMMIVLGDAPSLLPPLSQYTHQKVINTCIASSIWVNIYPVIIAIDHTYEPTKINNYTTMYQTEKNDTRVKTSIINSIYPNPATTTINIKLNELSEYRIVVYSALGKLIKDEGIKASSYSLNIEDCIAGSYFLTVINNTTKQCQSVPFFKAE